MNNPSSLNRFESFIRHGISGKIADVDVLMAALEGNPGISTVKLVDYALGFVSGTDGRDRVRYYLLEGTLIQRDYAALYFKRSNQVEILLQAFHEGKVDHDQAFAC